MRRQRWRQARRKSFEEVSTSSLILDCTGTAVSMSKCYGEVKNKKSFHKNKDKKVSGESFQTKKGADAPGHKGAQPETTQKPNRADTDKVSTGNKGNKSTKKVGNCHYCGKPGHWLKECLKRQKDGQKNSQMSNIDVTETTENVSAQSYLLQVDAV